MDLHPYDGVDRRYRDGDPDQAESWAVVGQVLRVSPSALPQPIRFDIALYSGGIGVLDRIAITLPAEDGLWEKLVSLHDAVTPEHIALTPELAEDFFWFLDHEGGPDGVRAAAVAFVNGERAAFQSECGSEDEILFSESSGVNDWSALWRTKGAIHFRAFSQG